MRALWVAALLAAGACLPSGDTASESDAAVPVAVSGEQVTEPGSERVEDGASDAGPPAGPASPAELDCATRGGRWGRAGNGGFVCYEPLPDANRVCDGARDCAGACLARSRTCAPMRPLTGCHDILTGSGAVATQCKNA